MRGTPVRHASGIGSWEMVFARPAPALRPFVRRYIGSYEQLTAPLRRRELPTDESPLIFTFDASVRLFDTATGSGYSDLPSFVAGAYDTCQVVESATRSSGLQIDFTLLGIRLLVGRPLEDMKNRAVAIEDVFGRSAAFLTEQLYEASTWDARFDLVDGMLTDRLARTTDVPAGVLCAWHRLMASGGRTTIGSIVDEVGWSQKHLIAQFRHEIGLSPKVFARILRFGRVVRAIKDGYTGHLADLALDHGYYDQAHLTRDVRDFAGTTPGELVSSLLPDRGGFVTETAR
jgi:AraC-like DNA-binding protein